MLKKYLLWLILPLLTLTSCIINSVTTYHKDNTTSMLMDIDMKEFLDFSKSMDSTSSDNKMKELEMFPKDWKNMYELTKEEAAKKGETLPEDNDSIRIFKKMFIKSNYEGTEMTGFSVKFDKIAQQELKDFYKQSHNRNLINATNSEKTFWDGKKLTLDTEYLSPQNFSKNLEQELKAEENNTEDEKTTAEQIISVMKMMKMKFNNQIKFDTKIKSISGKHDWVKQIDDYTINMSFSIDDLFDENLKLKNADSKIVIITK